MCSFSDVALNSKTKKNNKSVDLRWQSPNQLFSGISQHNDKI